MGAERPTFADYVGRPLYPEGMYGSPPVIVGVASSGL
jgi:hypothetical protein